MTAEDTHSSLVMRQSDRTLADLSGIQAPELDTLVSGQLGAGRRRDQHLSPRQVPPPIPVQVFSMNTVSGQVPGNQGTKDGRQLSHFGNPNLLKPAVASFVEPLPASSGSNPKEATIGGTTVVFDNPERREALRIVRNEGKGKTLRQSGEPRENRTFQELCEGTKDAATGSEDIANLMNIQGRWDKWGGNMLT